MTHLEDRLRALANAPLPRAAGPEDLRRRAQRRNRRRRALALAIPLVVAGVVATAVVAANRGGGDQRVNAGPGPDRPAPTEPSFHATTTAVDGSSNDVPGLQLFGVTGVKVQADPTTDLRDGDQIDVLVTGFQPLDGAVAVMCVGNVTPESAPTKACDLTPLSDQFERDDGPGGVTGRATVTAARIIHLPLSTDNPNDDSYDCAREPAGCVLAIAPLTTPVRAAVIPVSFIDVPLPTPSMTVDRTNGLHDSDQVTVTATGLRPNTTYDLSTCQSIERRDPQSRGPRVFSSCDALGYGSAALVTTDPRGSVSTTVAVQAGFYGYKGRVNCTVETCAIVIQDAYGGGGVFDSEPISFADDATFPEATLAIDPSGPYVDGQVVTLSGTGFPAAAEISSSLGLCPADKDPAVEERCTYPHAFAPVEVAPDGTFSTKFRLSDSSGFGHSCVTKPGCLVNWIIPHGPAVVSVPLNFVP